MFLFSLELSGTKLLDVVFQESCESFKFEVGRFLNGLQIEAEYRMIEAAVVRAVEEKHESESKVLDLQQEVRWFQPNPLFFCTPGFNAITSCSSPRGPPTTGSVEP